MEPSVAVLFMSGIILTIVGSLLLTAALWAYFLGMFK